MADLSKNSLWASLGTSDAKTSLLGPSYSYSDHIQDPGSLGVGTDGSFSQLGSNASAIGTYVSTLIDGSPMGNQFFVNTGGTCTASDGSLQSRFNYINNVASGLIPGVIGDIEGLDPLYIFTALTDDASPACQCYSCPTSNGPQAQFLSPELSTDFDPNLCSAVDISQCKASESFTNKQEPMYPLIIASTILLFLIFSAKH
jgi:hypothetical protein